MRLFQSKLFWIVAVLVVVGGVFSLRGRGPQLASSPSTEGNASPGQQTSLAGDAISDPGSLLDTRCSRRSFDELGKGKLWVFCFVGSECPLSNLYVPRLIELYRNYSLMGVNFFAIYPHEHDTCDVMAVHAKDRDIPFPIFRDVDQKLADACGVGRVPEVCVLDGHQVLRYRGRIDDQYKVGMRRQAVGRQDLVEALEELLAGQPVSEPRTPTDGCLLERAPASTSADAPTYVGKVASILKDRCSDCHRTGGMAPFALDSYAAASKWSSMIREVVTERRMPPWHVNPGAIEFKHSRRLSDDEVRAVARWADAGAPRGEGPEPQWPPARPKGIIEKPDAVVECPHVFDVPAEGVLPYMYKVVPREVTDRLFDDGKWIQLAEIIPQEPSVVHHVEAYLISPEVKLTEKEFKSGMEWRQLVGMIPWLPGYPAFSFPPDAGFFVGKGTQIIFEIHYTPNGKAVKDRPELRLTFLKQPPKKQISIIGVFDEGFRIAPRDPHYRLDLLYTLPRDMRLIGALPHMHVRGKSMVHEALLPNGERKLLFDMPRWDFDWQFVYWYKDPIFLPKGTKLLATGHFDNSPFNPRNPDPDQVVVYGDQTWNEMHNMWTFAEFDIPDGKPSPDGFIFVETPKAPAK